MQDDLVGEDDPLVVRNDLHQVLLDLLGVCVPGQLQASRDALHMGIDHDALDGLVLEQVLLARIADVLGTPAWVYSAGTMRAPVGRTDRRPGRPGACSYAVKANDHLAVLRLMAEGGAGADVVSEGEFRRAPPPACRQQHRLFRRRQSAREIRLAIAENIFQLNIESAEELEIVSALAVSLGRRPGGAAHPPTSMRHARQDHHRHGGEQVRYSLCRRGRRLCPRRRPARRGAGRAG